MYTVSMYNYELLYKLNFYVKNMNIDFNLFITCIRRNSGELSLVLMCFSGG